MTPIPLNLGPHVTEIRGAIFRTQDREYLRDELLEIDLASGLTISVGWSPQGDPSGSYQIVVFRDSWFYKLPNHQYKTRKLEAVLLLLKRLADELGEAVTVRRERQQPGRSQGQEPEDAEARFMPDSQ